MMLSLDTAYRSFGGEVEASSTPTICRLPDSRRHQIWAIAPSLVRGIAIDLAPRGITVNNVQPGPTETDMTAAHTEMVQPLVPLGRLGKPEEIAGLVTYLASPEAGFITGSNQTIDGGYVA